MKSKLLVMNMKMYMDIDDVNDYISKVKDVPDNVIMCPESIYIPYFVDNYKNVAIQSIYPVDSGAYTGCVSAKHAKKMGVNYAIVGHSECRKYLNINDYDVNKKLKAIIDNDVIPIMCIGESLEDKMSSNSKKVLKSELDIGLDGINCDKIIIAYEPIYSIGTGNVPTNEDIKDTISYIKDIIKDKGINARVLYGGSVSSKNIEDLSKIDIVDGFMIGKACTDVNEVLKIIKLLSS